MGGRVLRVFGRVFVFEAGGRGGEGKGRRTGENGEEEGEGGEEGVNVRFREDDDRDDKHFGLGEGMEAGKVVCGGCGQSVGQCVTTELCVAFCPS